MAILRDSQRHENFTEIVYDALQASCEKLMGVRSWVWMRVHHKVGTNEYRNVVRARVEIDVRTAEGTEFSCVRDESLTDMYSPYGSASRISMQEHVLRTALAKAVEDTKIRLLMIADMEKSHWEIVHEHIKHGDLEGKIRVGYGTIYIAQTWGARARERERYDRYADAGR